MKQWKKHGSSGICKAEYDNGSYLLLVRKWKLQKFLLLWNKGLLFKRHQSISVAPQSFKIKWGRLLEELW